MKKIFTLAAMACMTLGAFAQNNWYAGGSVGLWRNGSENNTVFNILPEVGYKLNETVSVGTVAGYSYNYKDGVNVNLFQVDPYVRYSFLKSGKVNVFVDGGVDLGFGWANEHGEKTDVAVTYGIGIKPGVSYQLSDKFSVVAHIGYVGFQGGNHASHASDQGGIMLDGNNLSIGFYYNF